MNNKNYIFLIVLILISIPVSSCRSTYLPVNTKKENFGITISQNKNVCIVVTLNSKKKKDNGLDSTYHGNDVQISFDVNQDNNGPHKSNYSLSDVKTVEKYNVPYHFYMWVDCYRIKKLEISKILLHKKNEFINILDKITAFDAAYHNVSPNEFREKDMLLLRNYGIIDIENNDIYKGVKNAHIILGYENIDINYIQNNYFIIEMCMSFENEVGKTEEVNFNLKFKRKIYTIPVEYIKEDIIHLFGGLFLWLGILIFKLLV
jgi:hypothetical protein